jgi:hypothetical protein
MRHWVVVGVAALGALGSVRCGREEKAPAPEVSDTEAVMQQVFEAIRVALPASADPETFNAPQRRPEISAALAALDANAALVASHGVGKDAQAQFLARSVARDARDAHRAFDEGRYDRSAFLLQQITENCVVCHTRLPSDDSAVAEGFVDSEHMSQLALEPRAAIQMATRRFDDALETLEKLLASSEHPALLLGPLTDYLVVSIRVKNDYTRPVPVLERFAARPDLWDRLRQDVETWIRVLPDLERRTAGEPDLGTANALIEEGEHLNTSPADRAGVAHFVAASGVLQRFIDGYHKRDRYLARGYYLLGLVEARIGRNYWVTPAPFLLETAIRLAPQEPFARDAYALLERETKMLYEGSDEEGLPDEDAARLAELRALVGGGR